MNLFVISFLIMNAAVLLLVPRRWAALPLLIGTCYMTLGQGVEIGPFNFTGIRLLVAVGISRVIIRHERLSGDLNGLDKLTIAFGLWAIVSSYFHDNPTDTLINHLGLAYNIWGIYFLLRIFCQTVDDIINLCCVTAILLAPVAVAMVIERVTFSNIFAYFEGGHRVPEIRDGIIRAAGPFSHAILAGTIGAVTLPIMIGLWAFRRRIAAIGIIACVTMILSSGSSGPILTALVACGALWMWGFRSRMRMVRWLAVIGYVALDLIMKVPAYYIIGRIGVVSGSTGWHRAALIDSAIDNLSEWWFAGTDYTRHWMPTGVSWSPNHTDITNHYIQMGVVGGLPLMILFILMFAKGFSFIGKAIELRSSEQLSSPFFIWTLGASLFAHVVNCISVSYFDQSFIFLYLSLAATASIGNAIFQTKSG